MKTKLEIFSSEKLQNFFANLDSFFDISLKSLDDLKDCHDPKNLSIVFFEDKDFVEDKILKNILRNENFIFVSKEHSAFEKLSNGLKKNITPPLSISKFLDKVNQIINQKKLTFKNIDFNNNIATNNKTKEKIYLTQAENLILSKLLNEKIVNKKLLERDALHIKENINTSSMESHLNRIRKKLKKIRSDFTLSSKDNNVFLEIINQGKSAQKKKNLFQKPH